MVEIQLQRIEKGIYSTGKEPERGFEKRGVTVAVHPFFLRHMSTSKIQEYIKRVKLYLQNLDDILVILEGHDNIPETLSELKDCFPKETIIIPTKTFDPKPFEIGWGVLVKFIRKIWDEQNPIKMIGGFTEVNTPSEKKMGCLGYTKYKLENKFQIPVKIITEFTFSFSTDYKIKIG